MRRCVLAAALLVALAGAARAGDGDGDGRVPDVFERGLVLDEVDGVDVLENHDRPAAPVRPRRFARGATLGYVTPWNAKGKETATRFRSKLTLVSPVWFQMRFESPEGDAGRRIRVAFGGEHDVDREWMDGLRPESRVVPRVIFELSGKHYVRLVSSAKLQDKVAASLVGLARKHGADGLTVEMTAAYTAVERARPGGQARRKLNGFVTRLGRAMHAADPPLVFVLVVPPSSPMTALERFNAADFEAVVDDVDYFSLMTYDHQQVTRRAGPNAPIRWVADSARDLLGPRLAESPEHSRKVLLGLNFYGMVFGTKTSSPVVGHEFVSALRDTGAARLRWDPEASEHHLTYEAYAADGIAERRIMYFPSLLSIKMRLDVADRLGLGASIWELGQGLDYFMDLL